MRLCYHAEHDREAEEEKHMPIVPQPISPVGAATAPASHPSNPSQMAKQAERAQALHKAAQIIQSRGTGLHSPAQRLKMSSGDSYIVHICLCRLRCGMTVKGTHALICWCFPAGALADAVIDFS